MRYCGPPRWALFCYAYGFRIPHIAQFDPLSSAKSIFLSWNGSYNFVAQGCGRIRKIGVLVKLENGHVVVKLKIGVPQPPPVLEPFFENRVE